MSRMMGASSSLSSRSACSGRSCARCARSVDSSTPVGGLHGVVAGLVGHAAAASRRRLLRPSRASAERRDSGAPRPPPAARRRGGTRTRRCLHERGARARRGAWRTRSRRAAGRSRCLCDGVVHCFGGGVPSGVGVFGAWPAGGPPSGAFCGAPSGPTAPCGAASRGGSGVGIGGSTGSGVNGSSGRISVLDRVGLAAAHRGCSCTWRRFRSPRPVRRAGSSDG